MPGIFDNDTMDGEEEEEEEMEVDEDDVEPDIEICFGDDIPLGEGDDDEDEGDVLPVSSGDEEDDDNLQYEDIHPWEAPAPIPNHAPAAAPAPLLEVEEPIPNPQGRQHVEDALRQDIYVKQYPSQLAGKPTRQADGPFASYGTNMVNNPYAPFPSEREWLIARWAKLRGPSSTALDELLKLDGVAEDLHLSFKNSRELNKIIDDLPAGRPPFRCKEVIVGGEAFDLYYRDALECVKALYGDPNLAADLIFKPERHYTDADETMRMYHDMHTGKWWWDTQRNIEEDMKKKTDDSDDLAVREAGPPGTTIIPVIISSDKTRLTKFKGKSAYPVYMTLGNIPKGVRRKPSLQGQILLAYLPTSKLEHIPVAAARRRAVANLFHGCMERVLQSLQRAGEDGVQMTSGDGVVRHCHPIFAAHIGDYPEQVLVTGVKTGECACCTVPAKELGDHAATHPFRHLEAVLAALEVADPFARAQACKAVGIKPIQPGPYWQHLPYANPYKSITPDVLHQLHQGVIKHLVTWVKTAYSQAEIDARCRRLPRGHHVRVFTKGITSLYQLTGREHADIARILLGLVADMPLPDGMSSVRLVRAVRALLDFLYLAQYPVHTKDTLAHLTDALNRFHANKVIFIDLGIRTAWNIPKLHFLRHYVYLIERLGTTDNFNTEYTERLHIDLAKDAYEATNTKDEFPQMTRWLERREKIFRHGKYILWCLAGQPRTLTSHLVSEQPPDRVKMTKHPSKKSVHFDKLGTDYGAQFFIDALARFTVQHCEPTLTPAQIENKAADVVFPFASVPVYHKAKFWLGDPDHHHLASNEFDVIHATPSRRNKRGQPVDGQFDTAFINDGHGGYSGVAGYRVAQVRVIFTLPPRAASLFYTANQPPPRYLAYVEWFTAFTVPDPNHRMFKIKRVVRNDDRLASIIGLRSIRRSVYLFPVFGPIVNREWTSGNVLDRAGAFYVDSFSDRHAYHTIH
ncbi:hypothetical protein EUX98_g5504 [Antrodiella citrinella]|uniref:Uncharacterized protein n=1 Tax=Antrodiella citrinella TaxID=2447956 RepID=A0A4S4MS92_9APHY|nr:hypothetical protein EUX98_g5504 [Antrodiella citrinella]